MAVEVDGNWLYTWDGLAISVYTVSSSGAPTISKILPSLPGYGDTLRLNPSGRYLYIDGVKEVAQWHMVVYTIHPIIGLIDDATVVTITPSYAESLFDFTFHPGNGRYMYGLWDGYKTFSVVLYEHVDDGLSASFEAIAEYDFATLPREARYPANHAIAVSPDGQNVLVVLQSESLQVTVFSAAVQSDMTLGTFRTVSTTLPAQFTYPTLHTALSPATAHILRSFSNGVAMLSMCEMGDVAVPLSLAPASGCYSGVCLNDQPCVNDADGPLPGSFCNCSMYYLGDRCEQDASCADLACSNAGTCEDRESGGRVCHCQDGFASRDCDFNIDDCVPDPCLNGGTCVDAVNTYTCLCPITWTGPNCEISVDDCSGSPCQNGGECLDGTGAYECVCLAGYAGDQCELNVDDCADTPCADNALCVDGVDSFSCACAAGYRGTLCDEDIDECLEWDPCAFGWCTDMVNSYTCTCDYRYEGDDCDVLTDECRVPVTDTWTQHNTTTPLDASSSSSSSSFASSGAYVTGWDQVSLGASSTRIDTGYRIVVLATPGAYQLYVVYGPSATVTPGLTHTVPDTHADAVTAYVSQGTMLSDGTLACDVYGFTSQGVFHTRAVASSMDAFATATFTSVSDVTCGATYTSECSGVTSAVASASGMHIMTWTSHSTVLTFSRDALSGALTVLKSVPGPAGFGPLIKLDPTGRYLFVNGYKRVARWQVAIYTVHDVAGPLSGYVLATVTASLADKVLDMALHPSGSALYLLVDRSITLGIYAFRITSVNDVPSLALIDSASFTGSSSRVRYPHPHQIHVTPDGNHVIALLEPTTGTAAAAATYLSTSVYVAALDSDYTLGTMPQAQFAHIDTEMPYSSDVVVSDTVHSTSEGILVRGFTHHATDTATQTSIVSSQPGGVYVLGLCTGTASALVAADSPTAMTGCYPGLCLNSATCVADADGVLGGARCDCTLPDTAGIVCAAV